MNLKGFYRGWQASASNNLLFYEKHALR